MKCPVWFKNTLLGFCAWTDKQVIKWQKQHLVFYVIRIILYTVAIFSLNNLLFLSANLEMQSGLIVFQLVSALLAVQKVYPRVTTNEGFRTLHKSVKHLLYTLDSPSQGIIFPFSCSQFCVAILCSISLEVKNRINWNNHLWMILFLRGNICYN